VIARSAVEWRKSNLRVHISCAGASFSIITHSAYVCIHYAAPRVVGVYIHSTFFSRTVWNMALRRRRETITHYDWRRLLRATSAAGTEHDGETWGQRDARALVRIDTRLIALIRRYRRSHSGTQLHNQPMSRRLRRMLTSPWWFGARRTGKLCIYMESIRRPTAERMPRAAKRR